MAEGAATAATAATAAPAPAPARPGDRAGVLAWIARQPADVRHILKWHEVTGEVRRRAAGSGTGANSGSGSGSEFEIEFEFEYYPRFLALWLLIIQGPAGDPRAEDEAEQLPPHRWAARVWAAAFASGVRADITPGAMDATLAVAIAAARDDPDRGLPAWLELLRLGQAHMARNKQWWNTWSKTILGNALALWIPAEVPPRVQ
eukprot:jgi/Tetstr1/447175/TSEL_034612.t1